MMTLYSDCIHTINTEAQKIQHTRVTPIVQGSPSSTQVVGFAVGLAVGLAVGDEVSSALGLAVGDTVPFLLLPPLAGLAGLGSLGVLVVPLPLRARAAETRTVATESTRRVRAEAINFMVSE
jgi:hypothetical protein